MGIVQNSVLGCVGERSLQVAETIVRHVRKVKEEGSFEPGFVTRARSV